jgi:uncharacterized protein (DUF952 family)
MALIYKILSQALWQEAKATGQFSGAGIDLKDGYIHFSTAEQMHETARLHFAGQDHLVLFAIDSESLGHSLKWEESRGGKLFPHVYGTIEIKNIRWAKPLPWVGTAHVFPDEASL